MNVGLLCQKSCKMVFSINQNETMAECIKILNDKRIGILMVLDDSGEFAGLVSERDVLRMAEQHHDGLWKLPVSKAMTPRAKIFTVEKNTPVETVMKLMTEKRVRHLPIMENNRVICMLSIGDVVKDMLDHVVFTNEQLEKYITSS